MSLEITIAPAGAEHLDHIVELLAAQLREHEIAAAPFDLREVAHTILHDPRHGFILLALLETTPIGIAYAAAHLSAEHGGTIGWLEELYVAPSWRSCGAGSLLLGAVINRARKLAWRGLDLEIVAGHERAVPLYLRHGFEPLSRARFSRLFQA